LKKDNQEKIICIIQARMGSSRLPGKVLKEICGQPMLYWVVTRAQRSKMIDQVMVATTFDHADDPIVEFCNQNHFKCFRGDEFDVLDRYYQAAKSSNADIIVRLTADCPLIDARLIDLTIEKLWDSESDFSANRLPPPYKRTYPIGLDVEVVTMPALENAWKHAKEKYEREHVLPYIYNPANGFKIMIFDHEEDLGWMRWTVDTPADLEFIRQVMDHLDCAIDFGWLDVLKVVNNHPELLEINADIVHKTYRDFDSRSEGKKDS
jgi:spore coat polysaccharide biosynthesis protein SpsF